MPLYDFRCSGCSRTFEALVRPGSITTCPHCGGTALERLDTYTFGVRSGGLSPAARRDVQRQERRTHADNAAFQREIDSKHFDD